MENNLIEDDIDGETTSKIISSAQTEEPAATSNTERLETERLVGDAGADGQSDGNAAAAADDSDGSDDVSQIDFDAVLKRKRFSLFCKRCFDIFAAFFGLVFLAIPFVFIAAAIKCTSKGPVFFRQTRVGRYGKEFRIFKFRTMVSDAESKGLQITIGADARVTRIGIFLRKSKIDELPQLFNVLAGQMSFVGPRPEVPKYVALYDDYQKNVLRVRPGITETASIEYLDESSLLAVSDNPEETYVKRIMPDKIALNLRYIQKMGFWYDIGVIFKTFRSILR